MRKVKLSTCGNYVLSSKISTNNLTPENYITTDNMLPDKAGIIYSENIPKNTRVTQFLKDDILLSNIRPYFKKIWLAEYTGGCSADVLVFRTNDKYDPKYIKYCLSQDAFFAYDMAGSKGSKMPRGDKNHILNFELLDYDIATQKNICNLLLSIDNKIKINNKINTELEKFAKTLYEYWFIQFDFPDEFGRPYKSSGGKMIYNKELKREIPIIFERKELQDFCNIFTGKKDVKMAVENGEYPFFSCAPEPLKSNDYIFDGKAILVAGNGSYTGRVSYYKGKCDLYQRTYACTLKNTDNNLIPFLYYFMKFFFEPQYKGGTHGSAIPYIVLGDLANLGIPYNEEIINKFNDTVKPILDTYFKNCEENKQLILLRNFLLPMLMNGQVTIQQ